MDVRTQATTAVDVLTPIVHATTAADLSKPTPCSKWTVRDLINHLVGGGQMFAAGLRGEAVDASAAPTDLVGDDPIGAYDRAVAAFTAALGNADDLTQPVSLPFATVPAEMALRIAAADLLVHTWDLASATGQRFDPPNDFVAAVDPFFREFVRPEFRDGDTFAAEVDPSPDAGALERLVAFAGRQP